MLASFPDREEHKVLISEDILYHIRFQNTGNDTAYNIIIHDTLSESLDPGTFELLATSHRENLTIERTDNAIHFRFDNIYLPDSNINEEASHGYVSFKIRANEGTEKNTELTNTAFIYFDDNPAVVTNQTENLLVKMLTGATEKEIENKIVVSPNPTDGYLNIQNFEQRATSVDIRDITGRLLSKSLFSSGLLDLSSYQSGLYFLIFRSEDLDVIQQEKVVLIR